MQERVISIVLALLMACAGCAGRIAATPESPPQPTPKAKPKAPTPAPPVTGTESPNQPGAQVAAAPTSPPIGVLTPTPTPAPAPAPAGQAPPATVSTYVYSPQDGAPPATALADDASPALPAGELQLLVVASATQVAVSEVVTVDVMASSSTAVVDAPLHLTFDPNVVESFIRENKYQLQLCYELALRRNEVASGTMEWRWRIDSRGFISDVALLSSGIKDQRMATCIRQKISTWRFPRPRRGSVEVSYPFEFSPAKG